MPNDKQSELERYVKDRRLIRDSDFEKGARWLLQKAVEWERSIPELHAYDPGQAGDLVNYLSRLCEGYVKE